MERVNVCVYVCLCLHSYMVAVCVSSVSQYIFVVRFRLVHGFESLQILYFASFISIKSDSITINLNCTVHVVFDV